jgi:hypothetical protein
MAIRAGAFCFRGGGRGASKESRSVAGVRAPTPSVGGKRGKKTPAALFVLEIQDHGTVVYHTEASPDLSI